MNAPIPAPPVALLGVLVFLTALLILSYLVLKGFVVPLLWAAVMVYVSWPVYVRLRDRLGRRPSLSALLMTLLVSTALVFPLIGLSMLLVSDLTDAYRHLQSGVYDLSSAIPERLQQIPLIGERLAALYQRIAADPGALQNWIGQQSVEWLQFAPNILAALGRNTLKLTIALLALFFLYRDGEQVVNEGRLILTRFLGKRIEGYWRAVTTTTDGVIYGLVLTALAQGLLAGLGYWVAGLGAPVLLGGLTAILALVPFGAPLVWVTAGVWLLIDGQLWAGLGLLAWGATAVSLIDNIVRPYAISNTARIPFFLVLLGVIGGLQVFGLLGLFVGPVVLAVMLAVWREWLEEQTQAAASADEAQAQSRQR